jgi:hypothetical protein
LEMRSWPAHLRRCPSRDAILDWGQFFLSATVDFLKPHPAYCVGV